MRLAPPSHPSTEFILTRPATLPELQAHYGERYRWLLLLARYGYRRTYAGTMWLLMAAWQLRDARKTA